MIFYYKGDRQRTRAVPCSTCDPRAPDPSCDECGGDGQRYEQYGEHDVELTPQASADVMAKLNIAESGIAPADTMVERIDSVLQMRTQWTGEEGIALTALLGLAHRADQHDENLSWRPSAAMGDL